MIVMKYYVTKIISQRYPQSVTQKKSDLFQDDHDDYRSSVFFQVSAQIHDWCDRVIISYNPDTNPLDNRIVK